MTDIFNTEPTVTPKLEDFVGEGKKYKTPEDAAKALVEKDNFILRLQEEARKREDDLRTLANTTAFNDRMTALEAAQAQRAEPPVREAAPPAPVIDVEDVVQKAIEARETANTRSRNLIDVKEKLTTLYGDDYPNRVKARAAELNISLARLNEMAADTPAAFFAMLGVDNQRSLDNVAPPATRQNSAANFTLNTGKKDNSYYQNLRRTNPTLYWTPAVQMEEYNELKRQGDAFGL